MKILLLDADGVALVSKGYFSNRIAQENNIPPDDILPFFKNEFRLCQQGKADLKEELVPYLSKWKWTGSVDTFLDFWFTSDSELNEEVFQMVQQFQDKGIQCYLASDQEKYRAQYLREQLRLSTRLDGCFFSYELGFQKSQPEYFPEVIKRLNVEPSEIEYFDDDQKNVNSALSVGIKANFFNSINDLAQILPS